MAGDVDDRSQGAGLVEAGYNPVGILYRAIDNLCGSLVALIQDLFDKIKPTPNPEVVEVLTFADVVGYFAKQHPSDPRVSAGALVRTPHPKGQLIFQVFLDQGDQVCCDAHGTPYGRRLIASSLDLELTSKFSDHDTVVFR